MSNTDEKKTAIESAGTIDTSTGEVKGRKARTVDPTNTKKGLQTEVARLKSLYEPDGGLPVDSFKVLVGTGLGAMEMIANIPAREMPKELQDSLALSGTKCVAKYFPGSGILGPELELGTSLLMAGGWLYAKVRCLPRFAA